MRAILIGSAAYKPRGECGDVDIVCDAEWKAKWDETYGPGEVVEKYGNGWKYEDCGGIFDVVVPDKEKNKGLTALLRFSNSFMDAVLIWDGWNRHEAEWLPSGLDIWEAPLACLAALRKACSILPSSSPEKWKKNADGYVELKRLLNGGGAEPWEPAGFAKTLFDLHRAECLERSKKHPKLAQGKAAFFGDEEYEIFDHDDIHKALSFPKPPAYEGMKDGEVWCSRTLWDALPEGEKLRCVVEEASILALERSVLPALFLGKGYRGATWAYEHALMKISTTITSGFFRDYCIESWAQAREAMPDFVGLFFAGVKRGSIRCKRPEVLP